MRRAWRGNRLRISLYGFLLFLHNLNRRREGRRKDGGVEGKNGEFLGIEEEGEEGVEG